MKFTPNLTRVKYLEFASKIIQKNLLSEYPDNICITYGTTTTKKSIGQCLYNYETAGAFLTVSLRLDDTTEVIATLLHEMIHASLPVGTKHGRSFKQLALRCGLMGKMTNTTASDTLKSFVKNRIIPSLGKFPTGKGIALISDKPKQSTRLIKLQCACDRILRISRKELENGPILCGLCDSEYQESV